MKPLVLISPGTLNVPEDVSNTLKDMAEVVYLKGDLDEHIAEASALLVGGERIDAEFLAKAPKLGVAARFGVGYDNVDVEACTARKVYATHTPDVLSGAVADHTWALILGFMRRIPEAGAYTRKARSSGYWAWAASAQRSSNAARASASRPYTMTWLRNQCWRRGTA